MRSSKGMIVNAYLLPFEPTIFHFEYFQTEKIICPASIRRSVPKRQAEFFFGRLAAHAALRSLGKADCEIGIGASREPVWPADVIGSISHTRSVAAALVANSFEHAFAGIDIEEIVPPESESAVRSQTVNDAELSCLHAASTPYDSRTLLTLAFSAKESLFKALFPHVGFHFGFDAARVTAFDHSRIRLTLTADLNSNFRQGRSFDLSFAMLTPAVVFTGLLA